MHCFSPPGDDACQSTRAAALSSVQKAAMTKCHGSLDKMSSVQLGAGVEAADWTVASPCHCGFLLSDTLAAAAVQGDHYPTGVCGW